MAIAKKLKSEPAVVDQTTGEVLSNDEPLISDLVDRDAKHMAEINASITARALAQATRGKLSRDYFLKTKQVTRPMLKHAAGELVNIEILCPMYLGKELTNTQIKQRATLLNVRNLNPDAPDGEYTYLVSAVLAKVLDEEYPNNSYVGQWLGIYKLAPDEARGKRYNTFNIVEYIRE